ncbi:MAG: hypothetical protein ACO1N9_04700 [Flavobacterium sp.]
MDKLLSIGRWLFPLSFLMYVGLHLGKPETGAAFVPDYLPLPYLLNYVTAALILLFIASALMGKYDKLAYALMALYVLLMAVLVHLPRTLGHEMEGAMLPGDLRREQEIEMVNVFRNLMLCGALLGFARYVARDSRAIG